MTADADMYFIIFLIKSLKIYSKIFKLLNYKEVESTGLVAADIFLMKLYTQYM